MKTMTVSQARVLSWGPTLGVFVRDTADGQNPA